MGIYSLRSLAGAGCDVPLWGREWSVASRNRTERGRGKQAERLRKVSMLGGVELLRKVSMLGGR